MIMVGSGGYNVYQEGGGRSLHKTIARCNTVNRGTHAKTVQLYPCKTSSMIGHTTSLYTLICVESGPNTLSNVNVLVPPASFCLTCTSPLLL